MREAGTLASEDLARRLIDFLLTEGIEARADPDGDHWAVWVMDEDHLDRVRDEMARFAKNPAADRYQSAVNQADTIRRREAAERERARKQFVDVRKQWARQSSRNQPVTMGLVLATVAITLLTGLSLRPGPISVWLYLDLARVFDGQVWRLITPVFLHGGLLHIAFNMLWLFQLGGLIEARFGTGRYLAFFIGAAIFSNLVQALFFPPSLFGGMSGVNYALFGYIWIKGRLEPRSGLALTQFTVVLLVGWLVAGFVVPGMGMANGCHLGGLIAGVVVAWLPSAKGRR